MTQPSPTDPPPTTSRETDHAKVLNLIGSPEMQRRLEQAREQRARVLAERAAGAKIEPAQAPDAPPSPPSPPSPPLGDAATEAPAAPEVAETLPTAEPTQPKDRQPEDAAVEPAATPLELSPELTAKEPERPAAPSIAEPIVRTPPVLRAPPRFADAKLRPASRDRTARAAPVRRRRIQPAGVVVGLALGMLAGLGVTWVMGIAAPDPAVTEAAEADPAATITVEASPLAPGPDIRPRPRPATRAAGAETAPAPDRRGDDAQGDPAVPPPIAIDDLLRSTAQSRVAAPDPAAPATPPAPARAATPPSVESASAATSAQGRPQVVVHLPRAYPEASIAALRATLDEAGSDLAATRASRFGVTTGEVLYFHPEDADAADRIARATGTEARDFSAYRPSPPPGTLEVRLPDRRRGIAAIDR